MFLIKYESGEIFGAIYVNSFGNSMLNMFLIYYHHVILIYLDHKVVGSIRTLIIQWK